MSAGAEQLLITLGMVTAMYLAVILYARVTGLRSFSKMSTSDFAMTVAVGSVLASAVDPDRSLAVLLVGLATLFVVQWLLAFIRTRWPVSQNVFDNVPLVLMANGEILDDNLLKGQVAPEDLLAKLREANVLNFRQVRAVILETTGDISVLHSADPDELLDTRILRDIRDNQRVVGGAQPADAGGSA